MIGIVFQVPGATQEMYDKAMIELNLGANPAKGLISHTAGPHEGGWSVVDVWESAQDFQNFFDTRLGRAIQNAGIPQPTITTFTVHNSIRT